MNEKLFMQFKDKWHPFYIKIDNKLPTAPIIEYKYCLSPMFSEIEEKLMEEKACEITDFNKCDGSGIEIIENF